MSTYYTLLGIPRTAPPEEVKRAFRREVARYHPDKVQHLGPEFQEIATSRSAALTEAYRVLMDEEARRQYDQRLAESPDLTAATVSADMAAPAETCRADVQTRHAESAPPRGFGDDLVKRAVIARLRDAFAALDAIASPAPGFDLSYELKRRKGLFRSSEPSVRAAVKLVPKVDAAAIESCWPAAIRLGSTASSVCVLLLGSAVDAPRDLGLAVSNLRRRVRGNPPVLVPVDLRDWHALVPPDTPAAVRGLLTHLRNNN